MLILVGILNVGSFYETDFLTLILQTTVFSPRLLKIFIDVLKAIFFFDQILGSVEASSQLGLHLGLAEPANSSFSNNPTKKSV